MEFDLVADLQKNQYHIVVVIIRTIFSQKKKNLMLLLICKIPNISDNCRAQYDALAAKISMTLAAFCKYWRCAQNLINECPHDSANIQREVIGIELKNIKEHHWIFGSTTIYS